MALNFQVVSTCRSGKGGRAGVEGLYRQPQHHRRILADGIEHHRAFALGGDLPQDVDALGFQPLEVRQHAFAALTLAPPRSGKDIDRGGIQRAPVQTR